MLSFRSILLAAAVFATIASAIPTPATPEDELPNLSGLTNPDPEDIAGKATKTVTVIVDGLAYEGHPGPEFRKRGGSSTSNPVEIFKNCHDGIADIVVQLTSTVDCEGGAAKVNHSVVISLLGEILALLQGLLADLKLLGKSDYSSCSVGDLSGVIGQLLILVIDILYVVLKVVGFLDTTLTGVVASISALLCEILQLVFPLVDGLLVVVAALIVSPYPENCQYAGIAGILAVLNISI